MINEKSVRDIMGTQQATAFGGDVMVQQLEHLSESSPALSRYIREDGFGNVLANVTTGYRE